MKNKIRLQYIITVIHFLLTFVFERFIFFFEDNFNYSRLSPISLRFSDRFELVMAYIISKVIAAIIIYCIWKLIFIILDGKIPRHTAILFTSIFAVGAILLLILFPGSFITSGDNFIAYAHAVNFLPDYWFSIYTSCYYAGCMMVFPTPYMIVFVHWLAFLFGLGYFYNRVENSTVIKNGYKWIIFIMFLIPSFHVIIMDAYRTELYCVLCFIYAEIVLLDIIEKRKRTFNEVIIIVFLAALLGVWRTEGVVLAAISFVSLAFFTYFESFKKALLQTVVFIIAFLALYVPQKVGDIKYYGNDYTIINLTRPLGMILNASDADLSYEGAQEDLAAIEKMIPFEFLKEHYLDGYRRRNIAIGGRDINQSMSALEYSDAFVKAGYNIIFHNPKHYFATQWNLFNMAIGLPYLVPQEPYLGNGSGAPMWTYDMWGVGEELFYQSPFTLKWQEFTVRKSIEKVLLDVREKYLNFTGQIGIRRFIDVFSIVFVIASSLFELIIWLINKEKRDAYVLLLLALLAQYIAIFLFMPAGINAYFRGVFFASYVCILLCPVRVCMLLKRNK